MHYLLFYDVVADYVELRAAFRAEHLALAKAAHARGELFLAGALSEPTDGAVFIFTGRDAARLFAESDPYVKNGLVTELSATGKVYFDTFTSATASWLIALSGRGMLE